MVTKKPPRRKRVTKKPAKSVAARRKVMTNIQILTNAGVITPNYEFNPADADTLNELSNQEVSVLIDVFNDLGAGFFEENSPNGFVF